jgi:hypothetical protein
MTTTARRSGVRYRLTLYISGSSELSRHAIAEATAFCEYVLAGSYDLAILDLESHAEHASADGVVATPTLILNEPAPPRRHVGSLTRMDAVARALGIAHSPALHVLRSDG